MSRELDAQIDLKIMGACGDDGHDWEITPATGTFGGEIWCAKCGRERGVYMTPAYSTHLNACATAEKHLRSTRPDLWRAYINALAEETSFYPGMPTLASMERFATASAEARCRAMLAVMEGK